MPRATKKQINIKMPEPLIEALKIRAESENDTFTDLVIRLCEQGLGIESSSPVAVTEIALPQLDKRIATAIAPLQEQVTQLQERIEERIRSAIQKELDVVVGECSA